MKGGGIEISVILQPCTFNSCLIIQIIMPFRKKVNVILFTHSYIINITTTVLTTQRQINEENL